jgi:thiol-disulfide isomerase/thioredoxin
MKRGLSVVLVLLGLQGLLVLTYLLIEGRNEREAAVEAEPLDRPSPALRYRTFDGGEHRLSEHRGTPVLVHFWATWCPPCREELPALLDFAAASDIRILAVSVDREWDDVREFLHGDPPPQVVLATSSGAAEQFGVVTLPESYLVDARGRLRLRLAGARDWRSSALRKLILEDGNDG